MMKFIMSILGGTSGKPSSMRAAFLLWATGVLISWSVVSIKTGAFQDIPDNVMYILLGLAGGKVWQRFGEHKEEPPK